jgi:hypothetical protein
MPDQADARLPFPYLFSEGLASQYKMQAICMLCLFGQTLARSLQCWFLSTCTYRFEYVDSNCLLDFKNLQRQGAILSVVLVTTV